MEKVAGLTAIFSIVIFAFGLFAARKTREIQNEEEEKIRLKKRVSATARSNDDTESTMAGQGVINSFSVTSDNGNARNSTGDRLAATSGSAR
jgi:hypothetical protein